MKTKYILSCIFILLISISACTAYPEPESKLPDPKNWELIFTDEFNGSELDPDKWNTCYPWMVDGEGGCTNSGNNEMQWYQPDEVFVQDGALRLRAQERSVKEAFPYTSGMVTSHEKFSFEYGYVEARIMSPTGKGLWPALWMMPEAGHWPPEIDILEILGDKPRTAHTTLHYTPDGTTLSSQGSSYFGPDFSADFHTFGFLWEPHLLVWYIDGVERFAVEREGINIPQEPFYLLANLAVGGNWPGAPDENTQFPAYYLIDYIRVFSNDEYMAVAAAPTPTPTGGSNILHAGEIVPYDSEGNSVDTFSPGQITWKVRIENQDGQPVQGETVYMFIESKDGSFSERAFALGKTDRHGWAAFSVSVDKPGKYLLRMDKISTLFEVDPNADARPAEITVR
jgi:beta-glucanase (GH16 family)